MSQYILLYTLRKLYPDTYKFKNFRKNYGSFLEGKSITKIQLVHTMYTLRKDWITPYLEIIYAFLYNESTSYVRAIWIKSA